MRRYRALSSAGSWNGTNPRARKASTITWGTGPVRARGVPDQSAAWPSKVMKRVGGGHALQVEAPGQVHTASREAGAADFQGAVRHRQEHQAVRTGPPGQQVHPVPPGGRQGPSGPAPAQDAERTCHGTSVPESSQPQRQDCFRFIGTMTGCLAAAPQLPWPQFLRLLRHPAPPRGWLEAAADLPDVLKRPMLLRWIAQHLQAPTDLRNRLLPTLPWRALAAIAGDASAHPQARSHACDRLRARWAVMTMGERRSLAPLAPSLLWPAIWKVRDRRVLAAFLLEPPSHPSGPGGPGAERPDPGPRGSPAGIQLAGKLLPVAHQVLQALDRGLPSRRIRTWCWAWPRPGSGPCPPTSASSPPPASPTRPCGG